MPLISENYQINKLKKYNINIKTKYIVDNNTYEKNTDNSYNDDIKSGIRYEKEYYLDNKLIHKENKFDSRIEYTFISKDMENKDYTCPNCGINSKLKNFVDGCPYCNTYYNIDYINKDLGSKYHYDRVLSSNKYRIITGIFDLIISIILSYLYIKNTSRTFNNYDIYKIFIYGVILSLILYYLFYVIDAYILLMPIKLYKDYKNKLEMKFWNENDISKKTFFNNINYELRKYYYLKDNIIDFDILDFTDYKRYKVNNNEFIKVTATIRLVYFKNNKIKSKYIKNKYILRHVSEDTLVLKPGENIITCPNCGASIDANLGKCSYCDTKIKSLQAWVLEK